MNKTLKPYLNIPFLICAGVLIVSASSKSLIDNFTNVITRKQPLPLQKPLEMIDEESLGSYRVVSNRRIENDDIVEELGTTDYLQCLLEDTEADPKGPVRYCSLFITYYTGDPDIVPHVPDECYVGSGNTLETTELLDVPVRINSDAAQSSRAAAAGQSANTKNIKITRAVFKNQGDIWDAAAKFSRLYFFRVNGEYGYNRDSTRTIMGKNVFGKYSYFSKVEWEFYGANSRPDKQQMIEASSKMLSVLIPVLERDHWPDWEKANSNDENNDTHESNISSDENN